MACHLVCPLDAREAELLPMQESPIGSTEESGLGLMTNEEIDTRDAD